MTLFFFEKDEEDILKEMIEKIKGTDEQKEEAIEFLFDNL